MKEIFFDMDGTIANLYGVNNWLDYLTKEKTKPYREAKPLLSMRKFEKEIKRLSAHKYTINILSWTSKNGSKEYNKRIVETKKKWLKRHCGSINFDNIIIIPYGTPKENYCKYSDSILFDDEMQNRENWTGIAYNEKDILNILSSL